MDKNYTVVGGGIAGIYSALLLANRGCNVTLIESSNELGGLLTSHEYGEYGWFDIGTHILSETGNPEIDSLLFEECYSRDWIQHEHVPSCSYFSGEISSKNFVDARLLPKAIYDDGFSELMSLPENYGPFENLEERINATFGEIFAKNIFEPIMLKFTGKTLFELADNAHHFIGIKRLICGASDEIRELKSKSKWHDDRLAYHDPEEGVEKSFHFYPKNHGIGLWSKNVEVRLRKLGVNVLTKEVINKIDYKNDQVTQLVLNSGNIIKCDKLIWSAPLIFLFRASGIMSKVQRPPLLCKVLLIDMVIDKPLLFNEFYLTCHDVNFKIFRVTNYFALQNMPDSNEYRITVEIRLPPDFEVNKEVITDEFILNELINMEVIERNTRVLKSWFTELKQAFPLPTPDFEKNSKQMIEDANNSFSNLVLVGRSAGRTFFMNDVINEVYELLS